MIRYFNKCKDDFINKTKINLDNANLSFNFTENNNKEHIADVYNGEKQVLKIKYQVLGYYNLTLAAFIWVWANPYIEKNLIVAGNNIKEMVNKNKNMNEELYYMVNNATLYLDEEYLRILLGVCLLYSKGVFILENKHNDRIEYILITDILNIS